MTINSRIIELKNVVAYHQDAYDALCEELRTSRHYQVEVLREINDRADGHLADLEKAKASLTDYIILAQMNSAMEELVCQ